MYRNIFMLKEKFSRRNKKSSHADDNGPSRYPLDSFSSRPSSAFIYGTAWRRPRTILIRASKRAEKQAVTRAASETKMNERARIAHRVQ